MNTIQAKQVVYDGINFRSKLEARWYFFMKNLGWNIEYEPHMENIVGWIPDFLILGDGTKILVEVKPFQTFSDFNSDYALQTIKKIKNSLQNIKIDAILLVGSSLNLKPATCGGGFSFIGGKIIREAPPEEEENFYDDYFSYTDFPGGNFRVGVCDELCWYHDVINNDHDGGYDLSEENKDFVYECWNKAGFKTSMETRKGMI
jgi:hypothetical protein